MAGYVVTDDSALLSTAAPVNVTANTTVLEYDDLEFMRVVRVLVPLLFGLIVIVGLTGNLLVILVVTSEREMRNTTNVLILGLALADLGFIVTCVPFTAVLYAFNTWPFGVIWCKIYGYMEHVSVFNSVYTLVLMSFDRYLAVVHPIWSRDLRSVRNAVLAVVSVWAIVMSANTPLFDQFDIFRDPDNSTICINMHIVSLEETSETSYGRLFYGCFFSFAYLLPLSAICLLYGLMVKRLLFTGRPGGISQSAEALRNKRRVTRLIVIVVAMFALCWLPIQLILVLQFFFYYPNTTLFYALKIAANCLSYANHCINPVIYAFFSENFRRSFRTRLCCCWRQTEQQRAGRGECEMTTLPSRRDVDNATGYERLKSPAGNTDLVTIS